MYKHKKTPLTVPEPTMPTRPPSKLPPPNQFSPFQREKLEYYYRFIVGSQDGVLDKDSLTTFYQRVLAFTGWSENKPMSKRCKEVHDTFFEVALEKIQESHGAHIDHVDLDSWLSMWWHMLRGAMSVSTLPIYVRIMPGMLFHIIDRRGEGVLFAQDLAFFYKEMVQLESDQADETAEKAYEQMTDAGRWPLDEQSYEQIFANFLIGRTPYGPGRYIFGCFEHEVVPFQLIQPIQDNESSASTSPNTFPIKNYPVTRRPSKDFIMFPPAPMSSS